MDDSIGGINGVVGNLESVSYVSHVWVRIHPLRQQVLYTEQLSNYSIGIYPIRPELPLFSF